MTEGNFVDYVKIYVSSGKGGKGSTHLHREKFIEKGGPDGGDGGRGGHVFLVGNKGLWTLFHLKFARHIKAGHGGDGGGDRSTGADGDDKFIEVPLGTVVKDKETGETLFEITEDGEKQILSRGGKGGLGNWHFRSSTNQTPRYSQPGLPGVEMARAKGAKPIRRTRRRSRAIARFRDRGLHHAPHATRLRFRAFHFAGAAPH